MYKEIIKSIDYNYRDTTKVIEKTANAIAAKLKKTMTSEQDDLFEHYVETVFLYANYYYEDGIITGINLIKAMKTIENEPEKVFNKFDTENRDLSDWLGREFEYVNKKIYPSACNLTDQQIDMLHHQYMRNKEYIHTIDRMNEEESVKKVSEKFIVDPLKDEPIFNEMISCYIDEGFRQGFKCATQGLRGKDNE